MDSINIVPSVNIFSVLKHINYTVYNALAEYIDNSIDSFLKNEKYLKSLNGDKFKLVVNIEFDTTRHIITIKDNAAGINVNDYQRAFKTAEIPLDDSKLSEFGMGMKCASFWFSEQWEVKTSALGEEVERTVFFDTSKIIREETNALSVSTKEVPKEFHYTVITLMGVRGKMPIKNGLGKVKRDLAGIYRDFLRKGVLELRINDEELNYDSPKILRAPYYDALDGEIIEWKQDVEFNFGCNGYKEELKAKGFVALMETMSARNSGIALFRRGRVIRDNSDTGGGFRPQIISGSEGSHRYKRLFAELHLEGLKVSHTKDGFQWDNNMGTFLKLLKEQLEGQNAISILKQADQYRVRESTKNYREISKKIVDNTTEAIEEKLSQDLNEVFTRERAKEEIKELVSETKESYFREFPLSVNDLEWLVHLEVSYDETISELFQVGPHLIPHNRKYEDERNIGVRLSLVHPFMTQFSIDGTKLAEPIFRFVVAFALSEFIANETRSPVTEVRNSMNEILGKSSFLKL